MNNDKTKLGVLVIGRKRPGFDQEWNAIMRQRADDAFAALGYETVGQDTPVPDDQAVAATLKRIKDADCDALLVLQPSIGNGQLAVTVAQHWDRPVVLWATPERQDSDRVSSCSLVGQHMLASILRGMNHPFELVSGDPADAATRSAVCEAVELCRGVTKVRSAKIGVVGSQPPGYIAMGADPLLARRQLGVQFAPLSLSQFVDRARHFDAAAVREDVEAVRAMNLPSDGITDDDLALQSGFYLAMRALMEEEMLDGLAVKEWPEISNTVGWPYLAFSRLAGEGVAVGMEGDADGALACLMGTSIGGGPGFITDWLEHDEEVIHFWHPGVAPLSMIDSPRLARHFNIEKPTVVDGPLRVGKGFTVARLWHADDRYRLTAFEGETVPPGRRISGNGAWLKVDGGGVPALFDDLCHAGVPHHPVLFEGRLAGRLRRLARLLGIGWHGR